MDIKDYIKQVLVTENPVISLQNGHNGDIDFLSQSYEYVSQKASNYIMNDNMFPHMAVELSLHECFVDQDIDKNRLQNISRRLFTFKWRKGN